MGLIRAFRRKTFRGRRRTAARQSAAEQYVREALEDEEQLRIVSVALAQKDEELSLNITAEYGDGEISFGLTV